MQLVPQPIQITIPKIGIKNIRVACLLHSSKPPIQLTPPLFFSDHPKLLEDRCGKQIPSFEFILRIRKEDKVAGARSGRYRRCSGTFALLDAKLLHSLQRQARALAYWKKTQVFNYKRCRTFRAASKTCVTYSDYFCFVFANRHEPKYPS